MEAVVRVGVSTMMVLCLGCSPTGGEGTPIAPGPMTGADAGITGGFDSGSVSPGPGTGTCEDPIDVVFVLDVSSSMSEEIDSVRNGIASIRQTAEQARPGSQFSLVVFSDDVLAVNGCAPFPTAEALAVELERWRQFTNDNYQPGGSPNTNHDCPENSLDALAVAATQCPWRANATRIAILVTDDTFAEAPAQLSVDWDTGQGIAVVNTYSGTMSYLTTNQVRLGVFAIPGTSSFCGDTVDVSPGWHTPYNGQQSLPTATGGRAYDLNAVRQGTLNMSTAISEMIMTEHCTPFLI